MKNLDKNNFFPALFVVVSLSGFLVFLVFLVGTKNYLEDVFFSGQDLDQLTEEDLDEESGIIIRDNHHKDPFITRNPVLDKQISEPIVTEESLAYGPKDAPVTIVMFSDFKCKHCQDQEDLIRNLIREEYKDELRLIWKDYPVNNREDPSWMASKAARCADRQGCFWDYHDLLYSRDKELSKNLFLELAVDLGLDFDSFFACLTRENAIDTRIESNIIEANLLQIIGIPFLYINGRGVMGKVEEGDLKKIIELELDDK